MASANKIQIKIGATNTASTVMAKVAKDAGRMGKNVASSINAAAGSAKNMGRSFLKVGTVGTAVFAGMVKVFASFDDGMQNVKAITGATGAEFDSLKDKAKELGSSTKFSATEAAEGMKFLGMAGYDTNEILAGIGPTLALAAAGGIELGAAADIASDVGTAFGLAATDIELVANTLARTATAANTDVLMMGETFKYVAPVAKAAGQSIQEMSAAAGLLGNASVKASMAGTDMKAILVKLSSVDVQDQFKEMGIAITDSQGEMRPMMDILKEFGEVTSDMTGPEKIAKATALFGERAFKSALIIADAGDQIEIMRDKMTDASVTAESMAATMGAGLGGAGVKIKSAFEGLSIAIIGGLKEPLMKAAQSVQTFLAATTKFVAANPAIVKAIAGFVLALTGLGIGLMTLGGFLTVAGIAVSAFGAIAGAVGTMLNIVWSPITLIVAAVVAAAVLLAIEFAAVGAVLVYVAAQSGVLTDAFEHIKAAFVSIMATAKETMGGISNAFAAGEYVLAAKILWAGLTVVFYDGLGRLLDAVHEVVPKMWEAIKAFLKKWLIETRDTAIDVALAITSPLSAAAILGKRISKLMASSMSDGGGISGAIERQKDLAQVQLDALVNQAEDAAAKVAQVNRDKDYAANPPEQSMMPGIEPALTGWEPINNAQSMMPDIAPAITGWEPTADLGPMPTAELTTASLGGLQSAIEQALAGGIDIEAAIAKMKAAGGAVVDGTKVGDDAAGKEQAKQIQQQTLGAVSGRLMTRGRAADPVLEEQKKQTKVLADIAKNTQVATHPNDGFQQSPEFSIEMTA